MNQFTKSNYIELGTIIFFIFLTWFHEGFDSVLFLLIILSFFISLGSFFYNIYLKTNFEKLVEEKLEKEKENINSELTKKYNDISSNIINFSLTYKFEKKHHSEINFKGSIEELAYFYNTSINDILISTNFDTVNHFNNRNINQKIKLYTRTSDYLYSIFKEKNDTLLNDNFELTQEEYILINNLSKNPSLYRITYNSSIKKDSYFKKFLIHEKELGIFDEDFSKACVLIEREIESEKNIYFNEDTIYNFPDILSIKDIIKSQRMNLLEIKKIEEN